MTRRTRLVAGGVAVVVVAVGVGGAAYARSREDDTGHYRTVVARTGTVEETLSTTGTVDSADRADVQAGVSGAVASVAVTAGQKVKAGAVLLRLGTQDLQADLDQADATLASARARLESDQDAQSNTVSSAATGGTGIGGAAKPKGTGGQGSAGGGSSRPVDTTAVKAALAALKQQQAAVTSAQSEATAALGAAADALADQQLTCKDAFQTTTDGTADTSSDQANQACQSALAVVKDKQEAADTAQQKLAAALKTLTDTLEAAIAKLDGAAGGGGKPSSATSAAYRTPTSRTATTVLTAAVTTADQAEQGQSGSGQTGQTGQTVTAATLAKDQAAIDSARADVLTAEQALDAAVITAPIAGTVAQLDLAKGDSVTAGDTAVVITNGSALVVTSSVSETAIRSVAVGQTVRVSTPGAATTSTGRVSSIGLVGDTSGGSATYPVTIAVAQPEQTLPVGSSVLVDIVLATARKAVTVPASAITTTGTRATVTVLAAGKITPTQVTLGAKGSRTVAVTKGLKAGARVVLADLDASVTGASSTLNNRGGFPGGGPAGGPGGDPGGGPPR